MENNNWIVNNKQSPNEMGMYETKDSSGYETFTFWNGVYWVCKNGHPIEFWKEVPEEPTDKQIENMLTH